MAPHEFGWCHDTWHVKNSLFPAESGDLFIQVRTDYELCSAFYGFFTLFYACDGACSHNSSFFFQEGDLPDDLVRIRNREGDFDHADSALKNGQCFLFCFFHATCSHHGHDLVFLEEFFHLHPS
ncbi:Sterol C22 desaturase [Thermotoga neapolitana DSM 4359]|uniref:Sterol C22 desaturase n=1 Tax=Thermotoga neapolitana (strain ATCC 49049 / DSM 4359 / NBRC 107923 / NS-E) TaxID=309803 RepID=B9K771_THENN|nr:Sterol C22 desaturase [Thermotoga neapolitana DSM 4359]